MMTTTYQLRVTFPEQNTEEYLEYVASTLSEALMMAERQMAGRENGMIGILPEDYALARAEQIAFNEADGLLV